LIFFILADVVDFKRKLRAVDPNKIEKKKEKKKE
jgi:hypothetical protein